MKKLKVGTLFSGYDSQILSLKHIGVSHEHVFSCEIDEDAIIAADAIHNKISLLSY